MSHAPDFPLRRRTAPQARRGTRPTIRPVGAGEGRARHSWRDWGLFAIAYGAIVCAILFAGPQETGGPAARGLPTVQAQR
ncbi:hypothetical protein [Aquabacter spiritensis]|uniref:Uncharacterized protein n=1 Tax=Aquabacter spiritensis TaxID=933073 RepID=A0A4V2UYP0_9HYPH|nr:hypothetical protein [Aquabacter spiritensis]TCT08198.1 hypothetical protein EDC64_101720 [Aquabacter spiritensis]